MLSHSIQSLFTKATFSPHRCASPSGVSEATYVNRRVLLSLLDRPRYHVGCQNGVGGIHRSGETSPCLLTAFSAFRRRNLPTSRRTQWHSLQVRQQLQQQHLRLHQRLQPLRAQQNMRTTELSLTHRCLAVLLKSAPPWRRSDLAAILCRRRHPLLKRRTSTMSERKLPSEWRSRRRSSICDRTMMNPFQLLARRCPNRIPMLMPKDFGAERLKCWMTNRCLLVAMSRTK